MVLCIRVVYITLSEYLVPRKYLNNKKTKKSCLIFWLPSFPTTSNVQWDVTNEVSWFSFWSVFIFRLIFNEALALVPLLHCWSHECLSMEEGLVVNGSQQRWRATHLFSLPPRRPTPLRRANQHYNQLVAIFDYNTWAALRPQADHEEPAAAAAGGVLGSLPGVWTRPGLWQRDGLVLLICFAADFLPLCSIQWDSRLSNGVWMTDLKTAGSPLQLLTIMVMHILKLLHFSLKS